MRSDRDYMRMALFHASGGRGRTWPNPSVGAVVVKDGRILGVGATAKGGRPHAETQALAQAGGASRGATLYVTLEPCSHQGKTAPCAEAVIAAGITRAVIACGDPNPLVAGRGFARLETAGIEITRGVCEAEALELNAGFFSLITRGRPFVTLKLATSLDGKIADATGGSRWITGDAARREVHRMRASHDALLTGIGTVLADDPELTCRLPGREEASPMRVVVDSRLRLPLGARCLPALVLTLEETIAANPEKVQALEAAGAALLAVSTDTGSTYAGRVGFPEALAALAARGITRLMVEAGQGVASSAFPLADRIAWFRAPLVIGREGIPALTGDGRSLPEIERLQPLFSGKVGEDTLEIYKHGPIV